MKIKNAKVGVRVVAVSDSIAAWGIVSGDTGTIVESDSINPWVQWDAHTNADGAKNGHYVLKTYEC